MPRSGTNPSGGSLGRLRLGLLAGFLTSLDKSHRPIDTFHRLTC